MCKVCGTDQDLLKDKNTSSGFRSICNKCNRVRQRIKKNGYDTGDRSERSKQLICRDCKQEKQISDLCPDNRCFLGVKSLCKACAAKRMQKSRQKPHSKHKENKRKSDQRLRTRILNAYGNQCMVCGEKHREFLALDHINNDGAAHKKLLGTRDGYKIYRDVENQGYPKDKYQLLCHNCNVVKQTHKYNPILKEIKLREETEGFMGEGI
jgi:hypothetical protein